MQNRVKEVRQKYGMTQEEFSDKIGVSRQTIVALEKGKYNPSVILACRIAKLFNSSVEEIFIMEEEDYVKL
ncbi:helix-turn-helix transcriptional regulator [Clostridium oryzae]|uniref:Anaerobic benzoate catabolism transcriptional regulator n=1 Tax=Clostridium oryzae TaxID=1450648 RepID=A0A1V4IX07_9CLOT|nr:helix-turn-helix transcriptional regulator [Clostridium oryzae]OPJ63947.1 anaerobic benzoate catabolism transcriptional regulator [Clostridium oryzae]